MPQVRREFALYPRTKTSIAVLGTSRVDAYFAEEHRVGIRKTKYPVESGATLTDNAVVQPERLRLEGMVSDLLPAPGNTLSPDRATDVWSAIVALEKSRTPFDVVTPIRVYRNMLIVRAEAPRNRNTGNALRFVLELEELLLGQTEIVKLGMDDVSGPAADRVSELDGGDKTSPEVPISPETRDYVKQTVLATNPVPGTVGGMLPTFPPPVTSSRAVSRLTTSPLLSPVMAQQIPLTPPSRGGVRETFRTILGGQNIRFSRWYQPLDQNWYMSLRLSDVARTPIATGRRLLGRTVPLAGQVIPKFQGQFYVDGIGDPTRDSWGTTHRLLYLGQDALDA